MAQSVDALVLLDLDLYKLVNQSLVFDHYRNIGKLFVLQYCVTNPS
jgi:hypothetical protein